MPHTATGSSYCTRSPQQSSSSGTHAWSSDGAHRGFSFGGDEAVAATPPMCREAAESSSRGGVVLLPGSLSNWMDRGEDIAVKAAAAESQVRHICQVLQTYSTLFVCW